MLAARFVEAGICARVKCGKDVNGQRHLFWDGETTQKARRERHDPDRRLGGAETVVESFSNRERDPGAGVRRGDTSRPWHEVVSVMCSPRRTRLRTFAVSFFTLAGVSGPDIAAPKMGVRLVR